MRMCKTFWGGGSGRRTYICRYGILADFDGNLDDGNQSF